MAQEREEYFRDYHKQTYVSNTSVRDRKNHERLGKLLYTLVAISPRDAGKLISAAQTSQTYDWDESDMLVINQQALATCLGVSQMTISRLMDKANKLGYVRYCGGFTVKDAKHPSNTYFVNYSNIDDDFSDLNLDVKKLTSDYYNSIHDRDEGLAAKVKLNDKCMKQPIWLDLKNMIEEANKDIPENYRVKFLNKHDDGHYYDSRYYSCLCNTRNPERHTDSDRYDQINDLFGTDEKIVEIDVNSMMYRTAYNLVHDKPLDKDADVYYELYKYMTLTPMSLETFKKEAREIIKKELMSISMDPRSVYCKSTITADSLDGLNKEQFEHICARVLSVFGMSYSEFLNRLKEALYQFWSVYYHNGDKRVFLGRMYFKYEAIVYHYMHEEFKALGIKAANVYDGFYFIDGTCDDELFYKVYHKAIDMTKKFLADHNHDLVKIYGKTFAIYYKLYEKSAPTYNKERIYAYNIPFVDTKPVIMESAEEHSDRQNSYVESVIEKCKELSAKGLKAYY